eukprot:c17319_g1_i1 orf=3-494(-)
MKAFSTMSNISCNQCPTSGNILRRKILKSALHFSQITTFGMHVHNSTTHHNIICASLLLQFCHECLQEHLTQHNIILQQAIYQNLVMSLCALVDSPYFATHFQDASIGTHIWRNAFTLHAVLAQFGPLLHILHSKSHQPKKGAAPQAHAMLLQNHCTWQTCPQE